MRFLNISDIKLKITLSPDDCRDYGIDTSKGDISAREVRQAVRMILERAEEECGFSAGSDRILVQTYPLPGGECELLITRLNAVSHRDRAALTSADGMSMLEHKRGTYRFSSADDLRFAVRAVYREGLDADLYLDDLGRYYLHVSEQFTDGISELEIFVEYGERLPAFPLAVLSEYGSLLVEKSAFDYIISDDFKI